MKVKKKKWKESCRKRAVKIKNFMISLYLPIKPYLNGSPLLSSQQEMLLREFHSYLIQSILR